METVVCMCMVHIPCKDHSMHICHYRDISLIFSCIWDTCHPVHHIRQHRTLHYVYVPMIPAMLGLSMVISVSANQEHPSSSSLHLHPCSQLSLLHPVMFVASPTGPCGGDGGDAPNCSLNPVSAQRMSNMAMTLIQQLQHMKEDS